VNQTNFLLSTKSTFFRTIFCSVFAFITAIFLTSCSAPKKAERPNIQVTQSQKSIKSVDKKITAQQLLDTAQQQNITMATETLTTASELFIKEADFSSALWLAQQLTELTTNEQQKYRLALVSAHSLLTMEKVNLAFQELVLADEYSKHNNIAHQENYYALLADIQQRRKLQIKALNAKLHWFALNPQANTEDIHQLWQALSLLSSWQVNQLAALAPPHFKGWQQLLTYAHKFGSEPTRFNRYLTQWQRNFSAHPAQVVIDSLRTREQLAPQVLQNIAVILPLSGKQAAAGKVAQQGILAAYKSNETKSLNFIDANTLDWSTLNEQLTNFNSHFVIGPLLKGNVEQYLAQTEITLPSLLLNTPGLNTLEKTRRTSKQIILSMRPEDEAIQAATTLSRKNYQSPVVLSHRDKASKRIAQTFVKQWKLINNYKPEIVYFEKGKKMQAQLKASLDVDSSQARIKDLKIRLKQNIKTQSRNRRDIDMFYIVGSPTQTKLLKPYIDVNTSPFAKIIPVYASSRSHSSKQDTSKNLDLRNLIFTEMPWLLKSQQQNKQLAALSKKLWPSRSDSLQSIFAMGYDSLLLVDKISAMQLHPYIHHYGQTGILKLNSNNILTRSLLWGVYQRDKVVEIVMD
jgi:outer membrane PBP1 activator LpoA protein